MKKKQIASALLLIAGIGLFLWMAKYNAKPQPTFKERYGYEVLEDLQPKIEIKNAEKLGIGVTVEKVDINRAGIKHPEKYAPALYTIYCTVKNYNSELLESYQLRADIRGYREDKLMFSGSDKCVINYSIDSGKSSDEMISVNSYELENIDELIIEFHD